MSPLYISGLTMDGIPLLAGIFRMKDEHGYPVDMSYEECKECGYCPDWFEYLSDAGSCENDWKFDAAYDEMRMLVGDLIAEEILSKFKFAGALEMRPGDTFPSICKRLLESKRAKAAPIEEAAA